MHQRILPVHRTTASRPPPGLDSAAPERKSLGAGRGGRRPLPGACGLPVPPRLACATVCDLVEEMAGLIADRMLRRRDVRRRACHVRQIAMYVCHVVLQLSLSEIGEAFGRDRTTAGHACHVVEDRRDDAAYDAFVGSVERVVALFLLPAGLDGHE